MRFSISADIFQKWPEFVCGVVVCKNLDNRLEDKHVTELIRAAESQVRKDLVLDNLFQNPFFSSWRKAYSAFGSEPSRFKCSSEALVRRILKGESIRYINKLVDTYNYISIKYKTPVGGEDLDKVKDEVRLKFSDGTELFSPLGDSDSETVEKGEVVYLDNEGVLCRRWNWRESDRTKLTEDTRNAFLVIDALPPLTKDDVKNATNELADMVRQVCKADINSFLLDNKQMEITW